MPFIPATNVAQVEMLYNLNGEIVENVYHVKTPSPLTEAQLDALTGVFESWEITTARLQRTNECTLSGIRATDLSTLGGAQFFRPSGGGAPGTLTGDASPNNVTLAVKANTTRGGRGSQGRSFWVGISEQNTNGNLYSTPDALLITQALDTLKTNVAAIGAGYFLAVLHSRVGGVVINPRLATAITSWSLKDFVLDSQRTRLPGHRRKHRTTP